MSGWWWMRPPERDQIRQWGTGSLPGRCALGHAVKVDFPLNGQAAIENSRGAQMETWGGVLAGEALWERGREEEPMHRGELAGGNL